LLKPAQKVLETRSKRDTSSKRVRFRRKVSDSGQISDWRRRSFLTDLVYPPCTPPRTHPAGPCTSRSRTPMHHGPARCVIWRPRAVGLGAFRITFSQVKTAPDTSRLHSARAETTSVCQAKQQFCFRSKKYSARSKGLLPEINSLFGPSSGHLTEPVRECWQEQKRVFSGFLLISDQECFSGKNFKKRVSPSRLGYKVLN